MYGLWRQPWCCREDFQRDHFRLNFHTNHKVSTCNVYSIIGFGFIAGTMNIHQQELISRLVKFSIVLLLTSQGSLGYFYELFSKGFY